MNIQEVGKNLRELRTKKGYTQGELAEILNVSHQAVSRWEKGDNLPDVMKLSELGKLYNVSIENILLEDNQIESNQQSRVLSTLTILSCVISFFTVVIYYTMLGSSIQSWLNILILYILVIGNSLLYVLPYSLKKEKITISDVNYLLLGISGTLFVLGMTTISVLEGGKWFDSYYLANGLVFAGVLILINISMFDILKNKLFGSSMSKLSVFISKVPIKRWKMILFALIGAVLILLPPVSYGGDYAFLTVLVGGATVLALIVLLVQRFNWITLLNSVLYIIVYGFLCFYVYNAGEMSEEVWNTAVNISAYYEDSIQYVILLVVVGLILLHFVFKTVLNKDRKGIYLSTVVLLLQVFSVSSSGPTFGFSRFTTSDVVTFERYTMDYGVESSIVFQIIILTIISVIFLDLVIAIRNRSLNKGE